jgi:hypothetical protein
VSSTSAAARLEIGTEKQLLFDDSLFAEKTGFSTTMNPAVRDPQPVLVPEKPWELNRIWWQSTIVQDPDGTIRLWYNSFDASDKRHLCLAESTDGVTFIRPELGAIEFGGNRQNNIVFSDFKRPQFGGVFIDPKAPGAKRYKLIVGADALNKTPGTPQYQGIRLAYSPDGIHWKMDATQRIIPWYTDTQSIAFYDDRIDRYVLYVRYNVGQWYDHNNAVGGQFKYRAVGRSESDDLTNFPPPENVLETTPEEYQREGGYFGRTDLYNPPFVKPTKQTYLMFPSRIHGYGFAEKMDVGLAVSRDGIAWSLFPETFLRLGFTDDFDSERIYFLPTADAKPIDRGNEVWLYYTGFDLDHSGKRNKPYKARFGAIGRARLRLDGYVSQDAPASGGTILT